MKIININNQALISYLIITGIISFGIDDVLDTTIPVFLILQLITLAVFFVLLKIIGNPNKISLNNDLISTGPFRKIEWKELDWDNSLFNKNKIILRNKNYSYKNKITLYPRFYTDDIISEIKQYRTMSCSEDFR
jgi:hypothetical protein